MAEARAAFSDYRTAVAAARVLVVGDVMLDRYWFGEVERISPEAPVPVVKIARNEERPGGAANVARNAAALGAQVTLISVVGEDEAGRMLEKLLADEGVRTSFHRDAALPTTAAAHSSACSQESACAHRCIALPTCRRPSSYG